MRVKEIVDEDFQNFKKPSMFIGSIQCDGKCCREQGLPLTICQNDAWRHSKHCVIDLPNEDICRRYLGNPLTEALVIGGLEPFEQTSEIVQLIHCLRFTFRCFDPVVIYTGYYPEEVKDAINKLSIFPNIIVKFGRYVPKSIPRFDEVLGVTLASNNQYAIQLGVREDAPLFK